MDTFSLPTYDLKGNRVKLPVPSLSHPQKQAPDRKGLFEVMKMFTDALQEEDKDREETLIGLRKDIARLTELIGNPDYSFFKEEIGKVSEQMDDIRNTIVKKYQEMSETMRMEKGMEDQKERETMKRHREIMGMLEILAKRDNSNLERLILGLSSAMKGMPPPQVNIELPAPAKTKEESPNLMRPASGKRIKIKWVVATSPNLAGTESITGVINGVNKEFYVSGSPIKNSEQIRLNGASPLSYGKDYTNIANKYSFTAAPPTGSSMEIKWQSR